MHFSDEWRSEDGSGSQHSRTSIRTTGPFFLSSLLLGGIQPTPGQHQLAPSGWRKLLPLLPRPTGRKSSSQRSPRQAWTTRVAAVEQLLWTTFPSCPGFAQAGWSEATNAERRTVSRRVAHRVRGDAHRTTPLVTREPRPSADCRNRQPQPPTTSTEVHPAGGGGGSRTELCLSGRTPCEPTVVLAGSSSGSGSWGRMPCAGGHEDLTGALA